jgi:exopolyphosphatase/guanosine-5'-triphosphate,3'-diphosphate pyrophosphatase
VTRRVAAIDLGSNSTRLLVADVDGDSLHEVERLLAITRLGDGVDASGGLSPAAIARVDEQVARYTARARELGADTVLATATSAVRDASNGREFLADLERRYDIRTRLLSGDDEARMTFRGVSSARTLSGEAIVCDIGGGSTELIAGGPGGVDYAVSLDMGCVRMSERFLRGDPPRAEEVAALRVQVAEMLPSDIPRGELIGVAGTITTLATIDLGLAEEVPEEIDSHRLSRAAVEEELADLATMPLAQRRSVRGLMPERAPTIVAGAAILAELMINLEVDELEVSERDVLHGAALTAATLVPSDRLR